MLVLSRKVGEKILIGDDIAITVVRVQGSNTVRIGVEAPNDVRILREEIKDRPASGDKAKKEVTATA